MISFDGPAIFIIFDAVFFLSTYILVLDESDHYSNYIDALYIFNASQSKGSFSTRTLLANDERRVWVRWRFVVSLGRTCLELYQREASPFLTGSLNVCFLILFLELYGLGLLIELLQEALHDRLRTSIKRSCISECQY